MLWANGPGAALLGYDDIDAVIGAPARLGLAARRQIAATSGFPEIGHDRSIMVRLASGLTSNAVALMASSVRLPDGAPAIMLAVPVAQAASRDKGEIAAGAISGFTEPGHFLAFIDARGEVEAATQGFAGLGIAISTLAAMVSAVRNERDRMIKRIIPAAGGYLPAGLARLTDERHLLVVVDERAEAEDAEVQGLGEADALAAEPAAAAPAPPPATVQPSAQAPAVAAARAEADHDHWYFSPEERENRGEAAMRAMSAKAPPPRPRARFRRRTG